MWIVGAGGGTRHTVHPLAPVASQDFYYYLYFNADPYSLESQWVFQQVVRKSVLRNCTTCL